MCFEFIGSNISLDVETLMKVINKFEISHLIFAVIGNNSNKEWKNKTISNINHIIERTKLNWTVVVNFRMSSEFINANSNKDMSEYCLSILNDPESYHKRLMLPSFNDDTGTQCIVV